jgi:hypothetical protein
MWDNRKKKESGEFSHKAPDFKCKDNNCDGVIWPEKKKTQPTPQPAPTPQPVKPINGYTAEDKEAFRKKDEMNARQSAYKGITTMIAAAIEAGIMKEMPTTNKILEKTDLHADYIITGNIDRNKNLEPNDIPNEAIS